MEQLQLLLRDRQKDVSMEVIEACPTFKDALKLCKAVSGLDDKQICMTLDIDQGQWARIFGNGGHFPENKLLHFMDLCGNRVPLIWLAVKSGYIIHPIKTELEIENEKLRRELEDTRKEIEVLAKYRAKGII